MNPTRETILSALPEFKNEWVVVRDDQDVSDIINEIKKSHRIAAPYYDKIALYFDDDEVSTICDSLFRFCKRYIQYSEETEETQSSKLPAAMLIEGHGDCKHYAGFCAGVLDALNRTGKKIEWCYRFASYKVAERNPHHVFVVVYDGSNEYWLDPTPGAQQKTPVWILDKKFTAPMALIRNIGDVTGNGSGNEPAPLPYYLNGQWHFVSNDNAVGGFFDWFAQTWADIYTTGVKTLLPLATGIATGGTANLVNAGSQVLSNLTQQFSGTTQAGTPAQMIYQLFPLPSKATAADVKTAIRGICDHLSADSPSMSSQWKAAYADILTRYGQAYATSQGFSVDAISQSNITPSNGNLIYSYLTDPNSGVKLGTGVASGFMEWIKKNPVLSVGIGFGAVLLLKKFVFTKKQVTGMAKKNYLPLLLLGLVVLVLFKKKPASANTTPQPATGTTPQLTQGNEVTETLNPTDSLVSTSFDKPAPGIDLLPMPPVPYTDGTDITKDPYGTVYAV